MANQALNSKRWKVVPLALAIIFSFVGIRTTSAQERIYFSSHENAEAQIVSRINAETVRLDIGMWLLNDGAITTAIINRHLAHVPVRVLGDRASIFESDPNTRASFERLANAGVPIRLRYNPRSFPEIMHWKCGIFVGQGEASLGSGNWTSFELKPTSATNFKDESVMITGRPGYRAGVDDEVRSVLGRHDVFHGLAGRV
jgi:phosphatidylserine/phosphatidylglycerophosphate/cardiolipin synthase-like enzyme